MSPHVSFAQPSAGAFWKKALPVVCYHLQATGLKGQEAQELSEALIIACALRYKPLDLEEAIQLVLGEAETWRMRAMS